MGLGVWCLDCGVRSAGIAGSKRTWFGETRSYLENDYKVVLQRSIPTQIRQLILYISNDKG